MTKLTITGIMPLRNAVLLGYPFEIAIKSLRPLCDQVVVLVDPSSDDDTLERVRALRPDHIVHSVWDMSNHDGLNTEIARQTEVVLNEAKGDWVMSLQADELLHEGEAERTREAVMTAERNGITALEMIRWYFFGSLDRYRDNWTMPITRLFKRGLWKPNEDAMSFDPRGAEDRRTRILSGIYHYSRVGDPALIAQRVRNLDTFYHPTERVAKEADPYTFELKKLDTFVIGHEPESDDTAQLLPFPRDRHPAAALEFYADGK